MRFWGLWKIRGLGSSALGFIMPDFLGLRHIQGSSSKAESMGCGSEPEEFGVDVPCKSGATRCGAPLATHGLKSTLDALDSSVEVWVEGPEDRNPRVCGLACAQHFRGASTAPSKQNITN